MFFFFYSSLCYFQTVKMLTFINLVYIIIIILLPVVFGKVDNDFIINYFIYKKTPNTVGFTCNSPEGKKNFSIKTVFFNLKYFTDDVDLFKKLNKIGIKVMFHKLSSTKFQSLVHADYYKLGIFIDL